MSRVVDLSGNAIDQVTPHERAKDAKVALRALLARLDSGEIEAETWLFIYEKLNPDNPAIIALPSLDSGLTISQSIAMVENFKFDMMTFARQP